MRIKTRRKSMAEPGGEQKYEYYEDELIGVLEEALRREHEARDFYLTSAKQRPWKPESKKMLDWLADEEKKHAELIAEHVDDIKRRLAWIHYKPGPTEA
jgi:rubrerythrin